MSGLVLVDTDVFSYWLRGDAREQSYAEDVKGQRLCLSFMSVTELKRWAISRGWGAEKRRALAEAMAKYVVVPFDEPMAEAWAQVADHRARIGRPVECGDCWIAATALRHGMPLVTRNGRHYADVPGLRVMTRGDVRRR